MNNIIPRLARALHEQTTSDTDEIRQRREEQAEREIENARYQRELRATPPNVADRTSPDATDQSVASRGQTYATPDAKTKNLASHVDREMIMFLTPHFTLDEFTLSQAAGRLGLDNTPSATVIDNLHRLAATMEKVRTILNNAPIIISSGYRSPAVNDAVGGVPGRSSHILGLAADFICPRFGSPLAICKKLEPLMNTLGIDQLIHEFEIWVHLGIAEVGSVPRKMKLTIDSGGTRSGFG